MEPIGRKGLLVSTWVLLALISARSTYGVEVLVIGNEQNPLGNYGYHGEH